MASLIDVGSVFSRLSDVRVIHRDGHDPLLPRGTGSAWACFVAKGADKRVGPFAVRLLPLSTGPPELVMILEKHCPLETVA